MTTLWDTSGTAVVKALAAERRSGGSMTSGCVLTLVVVVDEKDVHEAEEAAARAAQAHPLRLLIVIRRQIETPVPRLDAEVTIGGRLGPGEAVVMRMYGRLGLHAESVVLPLLAPDAPVVTWWHAQPPDLIAHDPLGVLADRRVTDSSLAADPRAALALRANDYAPGDTDLAWTRTTAWRSDLASAFDTLRCRPTAASVQGGDTDPSALLLAGWLSSRLATPVSVQAGEGYGIDGVRIGLEDTHDLLLCRSNGDHVVLQRAGAADSTSPRAERDLGDLLAEELRHLDADQPYGEALGAAFGLADLTNRPPTRVHIWHDPMQQTATPEPAGPSRTAGARRDRPAP
ncbi:MAG: glucose-6-phosphate dehydrogenase assembly protein OpcA [Actinobacteria bacterium]|nr:glucose-6-phosphate dehydrogenase assembly protein OpcA [Actinomycetota bacterium]